MIFDLKLSDLYPGDVVCGFEHWGCIPIFSKKTVMQDEAGLYLKCRGPEDSGYPNTEHHYLDGQLNDDGVLLGMFRYSIEAMRDYKTLIKSEQRKRFVHSVSRRGDAI